MSATNRYINFTSVTFTPTGGSGNNILGVQSISFDENGEIISSGGDATLIDQFKALVRIDPKVTIETTDQQNGIIALAAGQIGQLVFTMNDARNGATSGGGAKIYTVSNAMLEPRKWDGQYRQFGKQTITFQTYSSDGSTNPVSVAAA